MAHSPRHSPTRPLARARQPINYGEDGEKTENALNTGMWFEGHVFRYGLEE